MADEKKTDIPKIEKLIELMIANELVELEIVDNGNKIYLKRPQPQQEPVVTAMPAPAPPAADAQPQPEADNDDDGLIDITSPIIGTFYATPSPDSEPYVHLGSEVGPETVVCVVEAMKVMNEIKAETTGSITKIMVTNGQAVEFGQVLFKIKPN